MIRKIMLAPMGGWTLSVLPYFAVYSGLHGVQADIIGHGVFRSSSIFAVTKTLKETEPSIKSEKESLVQRTLQD